MTLAQVGEIFACWERDPPMHLMVQMIARLLGWTSRPTPSRLPQINEIAASAPPGLAVAHGGLVDMPAPVLDPQALRLRNRARAAETARRAQMVDGRALSHRLGGA